MSASASNDSHSPNKLLIGVKIFPPLGCRFKDSFLQSQPNELFTNDKVFRSMEYNNNSTHKFFNPEEGKHTARTATRSTKNTSSRRNRPKCSSSLSVDNTLIWEITERVDSYSLRSLKKAGNISLECFSSQIELGSQCFSEISKIMSISYPDIVSVMSVFFETLFKIFQNFIEFHKNSLEGLRNTISSLETKTEKFKNEYEVLEDKFRNLERIRTIDELAIEAEVNKMFPADPEEIQSFKESVEELRKLRPGEVTNLLQDIFNRMNLERKIPEETDMDFGEFSTDKIVDGIKYNYEVIVTSTIKSIKKAFRKSFEKISTGVQTIAIYIDPKRYEELNKQLDKALISSQSNAVQLEKCKEELKTATQKLEILENERTVIKSENQGLKQELEYKNREITRLKSEIESRKVETVAIQRQSTLREKEIEHVERTKTKLESENIDLKNIIKKLEQQVNAPISVLPSRRKAEELPSEPLAVPKHSNLDEITPSGLTVRQELEREYNLNKRGPKSPAPGDPTSLNAKKFNPTDFRRNSALISNFSRNDFEDSDGLQSTKPRFSTISHDDIPVIKERNYGEIEDDDSDSDQEFKRLNKARGNNTYSSGTNQVAEKIKVVIKKSEGDSSLLERSKDEKRQKNSPDKKRKQIKNKAGNNAKDIKKEGGKKLEANMGCINDKSQTGNINVVSKNSDRTQDRSQRTEGFVDKCCGNDIFAEISIGVQVNNGLPEPDEPEIEKVKIIHAFNPNNIYGLRGDVYYKNTVFQAQPRIPELALPYKPPFLKETKN